MKMAELPDLGKHCSAVDCMQLDFLPFICNGCLKVFCTLHRTKDVHNCSEEHVTSQDTEYTGPKGFTCSLSTCSNRELTEIICGHCQQTFCLSHRHAQDHSCPKWEDPANKIVPSKTAEHVSQIIASKPSNPSKPKKLRGGVKSSKTAAKVALMKMKMHALGDSGCPEVERVYVNVCLPLRCKKDSTPMFFSKTWSTGRVVDNIAVRHNIKNENNVQNAEKLRLCSTFDGAVFPTDVSLETLVTQELVMSGSSVILEYVNNDTSHLTDLTCYKIP